MTLYYEDLAAVIAEIQQDGWRTLAGEVLAFTDARPAVGDGEAVLAVDAAEKALADYEATGSMDLPPGRWWHVPAEVMQKLTPKP